MIAILSAEVAKFLLGLLVAEIVARRVK